MVEGTTQKDIAIQMLIKSLTIPVSDQMPVKVFWQRGAKKTETKKRLLSEAAQTTNFDERFEISTQMDMNASGRPTKAKMSQLIVVGDKTRGVLGKADLDMSQFGTTEYQVHRIPLNECAYPESFIEVHLKGVEKRRNQTSARNAAPTEAEVNTASSILTLQEDMEKLQKEMSANAADHARQIKAL